MTEDELAAIEALASAAQAGPWTMGPGPHFEIDTAEGRPLLASWFFADAAFVASAREDVPRLVSEVRRLRALLESEFAIPEDAQDPPKAIGDPGVCRKCGATSEPRCEIPGDGCCWSHMGETICDVCQP